MSYPKPTTDCVCLFRRTPEYLVMVNEMLAVSMSMGAIERESKDRGRPVKAETVSKHLRVCLKGIRPAHNPVAVTKIANNRAGSANGGPTKKIRDLAKLVQEKAVAGLEDGTLKVTIKDGLAATALLDKRDARMEDRKFMLGLARLLSGAGSQGPQGDDPTMIDVTPSNPLLAPPGLRGDE